MIIDGISLSMVAGLAVMRATFYWFFDDLDDFKDCVMLWLTPDIIDIFRGRFVDGLWADMKVLFWLLVGVSVGFSVHAFLLS